MRVASPNVTHREMIENLMESVRSAAVIETDTLTLIVAALLAQGHVLLEDVPGIGKTLVAKALARSIDGTFKRIQCAPDLLPSDITGGSIYNQREQQFEFMPGPIFANVLLVDEVNRASPRTQSSLLEAMAERQVTSDGITRRLERPFFLMATQNPVEMAGTFPLPEAQLDRFLVALSLGYPPFEDEVTILEREEHHDPLDTRRAGRERERHHRPAAGDARHQRGALAQGVHRPACGGDAHAPGRGAWRQPARRDGAPALCAGARSDPAPDVRHTGRHQIGCARRDGAPHPGAGSPS